MDNEVFLKRTAIEDYQYNEAMKTLRTNIQFSGTGIQVVMLTSSVPGEGKSETTFHLAASLAQLDKKVLLIDADIRKSILVTRYQLDRRVDARNDPFRGFGRRDPRPLGRRRCALPGTPGEIPAVRIN